MTLTGNTITLDANSGDTVSEIKEKLSYWAKFSDADHVLTHGDQVLEDERTLADCGITEGATLHLTLHVRGTDERRARRLPRPRYLLLFFLCVVAYAVVSQEPVAEPEEQKK